MSPSFWHAPQPAGRAFHFYTGQFLLAAGKPAEAQAELSRAIALNPEAAEFRSYLAIALLQTGQFEQALRAASEETDVTNRRWALTMIHFARGETTLGQAGLDEMVRLDTEIGAGNIAVVYAYIGSNDQAFAMLDHALATRDPAVAAMYEQPYLIAKLRGDPRLAILLRKLGLPDPGTVPNSAPAP